jgi:hypothetical protein
MSVMGDYLVRKKKPEKKAPEKPARDLTTDEAITRLFPKPVVDAVRRAAEPLSKPPKSSMRRG